VVDLEAKVIRITLTDGGAGDSDGVINGTIVDPGAPGFDDVAPPGAPTGVAVTVIGNEQVTVKFTAPASDGGSPITGYTVTSSPGGLTATGTASPIVVTGLANGTAYTFTVTATNSAGTSVPSTASTSVTLSAAGGGGCSMGLNNGPADPTLPLLVVAALAYLVRRRRA
jgi:hypothetical protein